MKYFTIRTVLGIGTGNSSAVVSVASSDRSSKRGALLGPKRHPNRQDRTSTGVFVCHFASTTGHGRDHGADGLRRHQRHLEHRNRGPARTPPTQAAQRPAHTYDRTPASPLHSTQRARHATAARAPSAPRAPVTARVATRTPPQQQPQPRRSTAHEYATPHATHTARTCIAPPPRQRRRTPRHRTPRTNDDARRRKDAACPHGHKAEDADRWGMQKTW